MITIDLGTAIIGCAIIVLLVVGIIGYAMVRLSSILSGEGK